MPPELDPEVLASEAFKTAVATAVTEATSPLQESITNLEANNGNLLSEKKRAEADHKAFKAKFEGIDVEAQQKRLDEVDNDETKALLAKGEYKKVYKKEVAKTAADHAGQLGVLQGQIAGKTDIQSANELVDALKKTVVDPKN